MSDAYQKIVRETREHWGVREAGGVDWNSIDKGVFDRIGRERPAPETAFNGRFSAPLRLALAGALATLIVAAVTAGKWREGPSPLAAAAPRITAAVIVGADGRALVNGAMLGRGTELHAGDAIEARGRVTIERPGKVSLVLEDGTLATVTHAEAPLVLALARGAVEARVVPVAQGEAFAVDVDGARIAVHGTHLRVARVAGVAQNEPPKAVVDLNEGVVAIGPAPRVGMVLGTLITAPAHAEFIATDVQGTLTVTHDAAQVRVPLAPAAFASSDEAPAIGRVLPVLAPGVVPLAKADPSAAVRPFASTAADGSVAPAVSVASAATAASGRGERVEPRPSPSGAPSDALAESIAASAPAASAAAMTDEPTTTTLATAVRKCMAERPAAENVTVLVETTLYLRLQDDGTVRSAQFEPPVAPDVNECATPAIYRAHFAHGGSASIVLSYVSK